MTTPPIDVIRLGAKDTLFFTIDDTNGDGVVDLTDAKGQTFEIHLPPGDRSLRLSTPDRCPSEDWPVWRVLFLGWCVGVLGAAVLLVLT
jgi:pantothenate kinase-related protein Tda10